MFKHRSEEEELMDNLSCSGEVIEQTLKELEIINKWLGGDQVTINGFNRVLRTVKKEDALTVADIGCGGGDTLKLLSKWAKKRNIPMRLTGIDANPDIIRYAEKNCWAYKNINFLNLNIFSTEFAEQQYDIVTSTLFCHHFSDKQLVSILKRLSGQTKKAIIINDLHRHWFAYHSIKWLTHVFSKSYMVRNDAKLSVLRAFKEKELKTIIEAAGFTNYTITWKWAFRFEVIIYTV